MDCKTPLPTGGPKPFNFDKAILVCLGILIVTIIVAAMHAESRFSSLSAQVNARFDERGEIMKRLDDRLNKVERALPGAQDE